MKTNKEFPNGFASWAESHYDIVKEIVLLTEAKDYDQDYGSSLLNTTVRNNGIGGLYELAEDLTNEFEEQYKGVEWGEELEYFDTMEEFLHKKLNETI